MLENRTRKAKGYIHEISWQLYCFFSPHSFLQINKNPHISKMYSYRSLPEDKGKD